MRAVCILLIFAGFLPAQGLFAHGGVVLEDDTILTVAATSNAKESEGWDEYIGKADVWAIRWRLQDD